MTATASAQVPPEHSETPSPPVPASSAPAVRTPSDSLGRSSSGAARLWGRRALVALALAYLAFFLLVPLLSVFTQALAKGWDVYLASIEEPAARSALWMTLLIAAICVPVNLVFGVATAWACGKFDFRGKSVVLALVDLPFSVSPVIAGLVFVLVFGLQGWWGVWLQAHNIQILFALPGMVLATTFVTFPFVARELIPIMQAQGQEQEEAARVLGASGWQILWKVTLPNVKWGLLHGVILCNARAMGEFGAVSMVSGHIRGGTNTLPLHIEILYDEVQITAAFAVASLLAGLALVTLVLKFVVERRMQQALRQSTAEVQEGVAFGQAQLGSLASPVMGRAGVSL